MREAFEISPEFDAAACPGETAEERGEELEVGVTQYGDLHLQFSTTLVSIGSELRNLRVLGVRVDGNSRDATLKSVLCAGRTFLTFFSIVDTCKMTQRLCQGETDVPKKRSKASSRGKGGPENSSCEYKGVRQRTWGKWVAEIRDPGKGRRVWLGTFNTKEEAAAAYDRKALQIFGPNDHLNLPSSCVATKSNPNTVFTPLFSVSPRILFSKSYPYPQVSEVSKIPLQPVETEKHFSEYFEAYCMGSSNDSWLESDS